MPANIRRLTIPWSYMPPTANHAYKIIAIKNGRKTIYKLVPTPEYKKAKADIAYIVKEKYRSPVLKCKWVMYKIYWPDDRVRDTENYLKTVKDSLKGVFFEDDRWQIVGKEHIDPCHIDRDNPRIEITMMEGT